MTKIMSAANVDVVRYYNNCLLSTVGRVALFHDLVWAKHGSHRWWPSIVVHPLQVPDSVSDKNNYHGDFVVRFLGT